MIKSIIFDISGVLNQDNRPIAGAVDAINNLHRSNIPMRFVTNSSRNTKSEIYASLSDMGFRIEKLQIYTAVTAIQQAIQTRKLRPYCLIHPNIASEFEHYEQQQANAVVITDAAEQFDFEHLNTAFDLIMDGAPLLGIGRNRYFRAKDKLCLDAGPFIHALEYAANREAEIIGKPAPAFFMLAVESLGCKPSEVVMIGDDIEADVIGAINAGLQGCLVQTGKYQQGDENLTSSSRFQLASSVVEAVSHYFN